MNSLMKRFFISLLDKESVVEKIHKQALVFSMVGSFCFVVDTGLLAILLNIFEMPIIPATILAFVIANIVNYLLSIRFIFINGKFSMHSEISGFFVISAIGLGFHVLFMYVFVTLFDIWFLWAKLITALIVMSFNFFTKKKLLFIK
ncbi:MAG: GtrA family protein [Calditrichaeota bacterium]|nr:MAG: GtrA family protein [Calditrichota bacterium]